MDWAVQESFPFLTWEQIAEIAPRKGLIIELGVGNGGSLTTICQQFPYRLCYGFDWFFGLPEEWTGGAPKGAFSQKGLAPTVPANGCIITGLIQHTLETFLKAAMDYVALVHFDMDLYSSTSYALEALESYFLPETILVFDEILGEEKHLEHEGKAFREWLEKSRFKAEYMGGPHRYAGAFRLVEK